MELKQIFIIVNILLSTAVFGQSEVNYEEYKIDPYELPKLLVLHNGKKVLNVENWETKRRPEILDLFKKEVYGYLPEMKLNPMSVEIIEQSDSAFNNTAIRQQIEMIFEAQGKQLTINVLLFLPKKVEAPPIFVGYNFYGNQTTVDDPSVILTGSWVKNNEQFGITENKANDQSRGKRGNRWPIKKILSEGFGVATIYYGDVDPDRNDFSDGIHSLFYSDNQVKPDADEWGSISAWAWGMSRVMDHFESAEQLRQSKFILFGHSRLGKTSLWAGALDERFDIVISNNSGCGGAALFRRNYGETISIINKNFPHWFSSNFKKYNKNASHLPIDQHMLIALIAPRPVYIASAEEDRWADPKGEFLSGFHGTPIYELYKKSGLTSQELPEIGEPIHNTIGYHIRSGKHDVTDYDWKQFMKFAKKHLKD